MKPDRWTTRCAATHHYPLAASAAPAPVFSDNAGRVRSTADSMLPPPPPRSGMPGSVDWPLCTFLELGALPTAVPCGRLHARQLVWEWGLADLSDTVQLVVSELLTNAITASRRMTRPRPVKLWLLSDKSRVAVLVWDGDPRPPARADAGLDDEAGRGLLLVEALSSRWDWSGGGEHGSKVVWAEIASE